MKPGSVKKRRKSKSNGFFLQLSKMSCQLYCNTKDVADEQPEFTNKKREAFMAENKGEPSGSVAHTKNAGKQGDIEEIGKTSGAKKKILSSDAGMVEVAGCHPQQK